MEAGCSDRCDARIPAVPSPPSAMGQIRIVASGMVSLMTDAISSATSVAARVFLNLSGAMSMLGITGVLLLKINKNLEYAEFFRPFRVAG